MTGPKTGWKLDREAHAVSYWTPTGMIWFKICRTWDGRFIWDGKLLPWAGWRREELTKNINQHTLTPAKRHMRGWLLWIPFFMVWRLCNEVDQITITTPGDSSTLH